MHRHRYMGSIGMFQNDVATTLPNGHKAMPIEDSEELIRGNSGQFRAQAGMRTLAVATSR